MIYEVTDKWGDSVRFTKGTKGILVKVPTSDGIDTRSVLIDWKSIETLIDYLSTAIEEGIE